MSNVSVGDNLGPAIGSIIDSQISQNLPDFLGLSRVDFFLVLACHSCLQINSI